MAQGKDSYRKGPLGQAYDHQGQVKGGTLQGCQPLEGFPGTGPDPFGEEGPKEKNSDKSCLKNSEKSQEINYGIRFFAPPWGPGSGPYRIVARTGLGQECPNAYPKGRLAGLCPCGRGDLWGT